jgi:L-arabinokinase
MPAPRHLAFFLTAHGFGHGVRQTAFIHALPADIEVTVFTDLPIEFFGEELKRLFHYRSMALDCGCIQPDNTRVDIQATLQRYRELHANREVLIQEAAGALKKSGADFVIGDAPPMVFPAAKLAGIPAWAVCNFSWTDIYRPYLEIDPTFQSVWDQMRADYAEADKHVRLRPFTGEALCQDNVEIGMLTRPGTPSREALASRLGIDPTKRWCLIYLGNYGLPGIRWERLEEYSDWEFLGLYPCGAARNFTHIRKDPSLRYADLTASADLVLGKLGYGLVTECATLGTPVLYLGRENFCEYEALKSFLEERGLGLQIQMDDLLSLEIGSYLNHPWVQSHTHRSRALPATGMADLRDLLGIR